MGAEELIHKFAEEAKDCSDDGSFLGELPLQVQYDPLDSESISALAAVFNELALTGWDNPLDVEVMTEHVPRGGSYAFEFMDSVVWKVRSTMMDAAVEWVRRRYGNAPARELVGFLEGPDAGVYALAQAGHEHVEEVG